jgi:hypothetical protein
MAEDVVRVGYFDGIELPFTPADRTPEDRAALLHFAALPPEARPRTDAEIAAFIARDPAEREQDPRRRAAVSPRLRGQTEAEQATIDRFVQAVDQNPAEQAALARFLALGPADRRGDSRHVYAYYRDFRDWVESEPIDARMGVPARPEDIWRHVRPTGAHAIRRGGDPHVYIAVEAECDWEEEHGLMLVWCDGARLTKCGGFDGHPTNVNASADPALADVVYRGLDPAWTTRRDGP